MLDDGSKPRLGAALELASAQWRLALQQAMARQNAPWLGAGGDVLAHIPGQGVGQTALSERLGLSKQAVQQFLDQLEKLALIRREPDPVDRRAKLVFLTEAGITALAARTAAEERIERAFRDLVGKKRFGRLRKALGRISAAPGSTGE